MRKLIILFVGVVLSVVAMTAVGSTPRTDAAPGDVIPAIAGRRTASSYRDTTCMIMADTTLRCWGVNRDGQVGDGTTDHADAPTVVAGLSGVVDVSAGSDATCAVVRSGQLYCWGTDSNGEMGNGPAGSDDVLVPSPVPGMGNTVDVAAGYDHVCAATSNGAVYCWGEGRDDQLGTGTTDDEVSPFRVPGIDDAVAVAAAEKTSCALHDTGQVSCWGENSDLTVGNGTSTTVLSPALVSGIDTAIDIEIHEYISCALLANGTVACWGTAGFGILNPGSSTPAIITGLTSVEMLRVYSDTLCAVRSDTSVWCSSYNDGAPTVPGSMDTTGGPVDTGLSGVADLTIGWHHGCAVMADGTARCWGDNQDDVILGFGFAGTHVGPLEITSLTNVTDIDAGGETTCAIATSAVFCWGNNHNNHAGPSSAPIVHEPTKVGVNDATRVSVGQDHACAVRTSGQIVCWGVGSVGQLGNGGYQDSATPVTVDGGLYSDVTAGTQHTCAITVGGQAECWGSDLSGQLGEGPSANNGSPRPVPVLSLNSVVSLSAGSAHTCAATAQHKVHCWGDGSDGRLGNGGTTDSQTPVAVSGGSDFVAITAGRNHTCAAMLSGLSCWGSNSIGKVANAAGSSYTTPYATSSDISNGSIDAGYDHTCAVRTSGDAVCWGDYRGGRTGPGRGLTDSGTPLPVAGIGTPVQVTGGLEHSCARTNSGKVWCWGDNTASQLAKQSAFVDPTRLPLATLAYVEREPTPPPPPTNPGDPDDPGDPGDPTDPDDPDDPDDPYDPDDPGNPEDAGGVFGPVDPGRLLETRVGAGLTTVDGLFEGIGRRSADSETRVDVAGRAGIPSDAAAAVINVTAIRAPQTGFVTVHPCLAMRPTTASLNYTAGVNLGNEIVAELDGSGDICVYTNRDIDLTIDAVAYLPATSPYVPAGPARLVDTRAGQATVDGRHAGGGRRDAAASYRVEIAGRAGIPADAAAAVLYVAGVKPSSTGYVTVHPCAPSTPTAASLNFVAGVNRGNELIAPLDADGEVCIYTSESVEVTVDVVGYLPAGTAYHPVSPVRLLETRSGPGLTTIDGAFEGVGAASAGSTIELDVAGRAGVPAGSTAVVVNVTAVKATVTGFVTVHPCLATLPNASSLNYVAGVNGGNEIVAQLDGAGRICLYTERATHLTVDIAGYVT